MLDYKDIITKRYLLQMSGHEIAEQVHASKSGVYDFLAAFERSDKISFPLPEGITNYGIHELVYGHVPGSNTRNEDYKHPDYEDVFRQMSERKNMTLVYQWNRYKKRCESEGTKAYQYRQFCDLYTRWCNDNYETLHIPAVIGQTMEVDFAGKTFTIIDKLTGETTPVVVFVSILPYSQMIYAEGMTSTKEPQWIEVNNHALQYFGGVPAIVVCDNCKQAVIANNDWIDPDLNDDYAAWADHNHTAILPAKVRKPKYKSSVENAVGILEKGFFHDLEEMPYFSLEQFNHDLWEKLGELNHQNFKKKDCSRHDLWIEEQKELLPLPSMYYRYMERKTAKVSGDYHVRFDNAYYSVDKAFLHKSVTIGATSESAFKAFLLPLVIYVRDLGTIFFGQLDILLFIRASHLPQIHKEDFTFTVAEAFDFAVLLNHSCFLILVQNPKRYADVGGIEKVSRQNDDCFDKVIVDKLLSDLQLGSVIGQSAVCKQEPGNAVLREL